MKSIMPAGDIPQRERRVTQVYLVEHEYATLAKLFAGRKLKKLKKRDAKKSPMPSKKLVGIKTATPYKKKVAKAPTAARGKTPASVRTKPRAVKKVAKPPAAKPKKTVKKAPAARGPKTKTVASKGLAPSSKPKGTGKKAPPRGPRTKTFAAPPAPTFAPSPPIQFHFGAPLAMPANPDADKPPQNIVTIRTLAGKRIVIPIVPDSNTVKDLKNKVEDALGIPSDQQRLIGAGRELSPDEAPLQTLGIRAEAHIYVLLRLRAQ